MAVAPANFREAEVDIRQTGPHRDMADVKRLGADRTYHDYKRDILS